MKDPLDLAGERGRLPAPLPELQALRDLLANPPSPPPQLIEGILHQGCKMILGGTSKTNKSWCLLDLALSVASGQPWWGRPCTATPVVYLNFELPAWAIIQRVQALLRPGRSPPPPPCTSGTCAASMPTLPRCGPGWSKAWPTSSAGS